MNFARDGLLEADGDEVVAFLREQGQLPDLRELRVVLAGFGDTTDPQKTLDQAHRDRLLGIWRAVLTAAGAEVQVDGSPRSGAAPASVPEVTTVDVPDPAPFPHTCSIRNFRLPDTGAVGFQENTPALREPTAARQAVEQIVAALRACPGVRIQLTGATSSYGDQTPAGEADRRWLSLARADAVRGLMTAAGLDASRIEIRGDGYHFDGYVPDRDGAGVLLPGPAAQNRCVLVSLV
ncbi:OmpA family protein [Nocardia sp. NPDC003482]